MVNQLAHVCRLTLDRLYLDVVMSVKVTTNVGLKNTVTTSSVKNLARSVEKVRLAQVLSTIVLSASAPRVTLDQLSENVDQSVTEMLTVLDLVQLATMESVRTLATVLAVLVLIATSVD